jgi:hypothetical protein
MSMRELHSRRCVMGMDVQTGSVLFRAALPKSEYGGLETAIHEAPSTKEGSSAPLVCECNGAFWSSLHLPRRDCRCCKTSHTNQVVGRTGERKDPVHFKDSAMPHSTHDRLQPPEAFFDSLPFLLADGVARVNCWRTPARCTRPRAVTRHWLSEMEELVNGKKVRLGVNWG